MNKFKEFLRKVWNFILRIKNYVRTDGLLHIETVFIIYVISEAIFTWWIALSLALLAIGGKELYDYLSKKGTAEWHDVWCGLAGLLLAILITLIP